MNNLSRSRGRQLKELGLKASSDPRVNAPGHWHSAICPPNRKAFPAKVILQRQITLCAHLQKMLITNLRRAAPYCSAFGLAGKWLACSLRILEVGKSLKDR